MQYCHHNSSFYGYYKKAFRFVRFIQAVSGSKKKSLHFLFPFWLFQFYITFRYFIGLHKNITHSPPAFPQVSFVLNATSGIPSLLNHKLSVKCIMNGHLHLLRYRFYKMPVRFCIVLSVPKRTCRAKESSKIESGDAHVQN